MTRTLGTKYPSDCMRVESLADALKRFFSPVNVVTVTEVDAASELGQRGLSIEGTHTMAVKALMAHANPVLSKLGQRVWEVFHFRIVHAALIETVKTPHFGAFRKADGTQQGVMFLPLNWTEMVSKEPIMQFGAVIFTGSQAVDYYNGRIGTDGVERISDRASAYEAEMLKDVHRSLLNNYQRHVLEKFPNGFEPHLGYAYRDVQASRA